MKAEGFIWNCIVFLLLMFFLYLVYFLYLVITNKNIKEGYTFDYPVWNRLKGIVNLCSINDIRYNTSQCVDISYADYDNNINSAKAILEPGYGIDPNSGFVTYLDEPTAPEYTIPSTTRDIFARDYTNNNNNSVQNVSLPDLSGEIIYDSQSISRFGPSSYVPTYEETVFLSKLTNEVPFLPITKQESGSVGFCQQNASVSLDTIEKKCNSLDNETCASTDCCVLLGGEKCVAGSQTGPSIQSNYNDLSLKNTDYYYYRGRCYGNCSRSYGIKNTTGYNSSIIEAVAFSTSTENFSNISVIDRIPFIPPKWDESSELHDTGNWNDWYYAMTNGAISYK